MSGRHMIKCIHSVKCAIIKYSVQRALKVEQDRLPSKTTSCDFKTGGQQESQRSLSLSISAFEWQHQKCILPPPPPPPEISKKSVYKNFKHGFSFSRHFTLRFSKKSPVALSKDL
uniref:Uncharacterized protein n=1 Tax=Cacopsylla melanoneura TaxID=428564 RepID=A0A8D8U9E5_9HEMI